MKRVLAMILQLCLFAFCITACGRSEVSRDASVPARPAEQDLETTAKMGEQETAEPEERNTEPMAEQEQTEQSEAAESTEPTSQKQTEYLEAIPAAYFENLDRPGQVIQVTYESQDYTGDDTAITKPAFVYLPYGYDESDTDTQYDILYLMHGWTMTANDFLGEGRSNLVNILDNMIAFGDIPPVIVVSATFDAENQPQSFSRSVEELSVFHNDLRQNLMPFIENRFHTYAKDVTEEGFENSREHRAFGGFSLGAVTTWYQFIYNLDYIKNFVPMSGDCWIMGTYGGRYYPVETVDYLEDMLSEGGYEEDGFRIYQGIGTDDPIWDQTDSQIQEMFTRETFTSQNLHYAIIEGGRHDIDACERYLYYALQDFFGGEE